LGRRWAEGIAVLSRFPIRGQVDADLSRTESPRSYRRRVLQEVVVTTGAGAVRVANTHLSSDDDDARAAQARRAVLLLAVPTAGVGVERTLLAGDLNCADDDAVIGAFARAGLRDAWTDGGHRGGGATNPAGDPTARLDHVLVGADFTVEAVRVVDDGGAEAHSDHLPVVVDLVVR
jgi:endonuclease/exonuclease/phosphatase family metal-dependent hydrolase